jgi:predicted signal transduction protein with EAL and GGDEF domain
LSGVDDKLEQRSQRSLRVFAGPRLVLLVSAFALCGSLAAGLIGLEVVRRDDARMLQLQHRLVQSAAAQLGSHPLGSDAAATISQSIGLTGLAFEAEPVTDGRAQQAVMDADGRIAGFFTWDGHQSSRTIEQLGMLIATSFAALLLLTGASFSQLQRTRRKLQAAATQAAVAADTDKLSGLPTQGKMLDLLEEALQRRSVDESVVFALVEMDGIENGVLGATELIVSIAKRLREALPQPAVCGRIGVTQFAIILSAQPQDIQAVLRHILDEFERPYWMEKVVRLTVQAGFAQAPEHAVSRSELTRRAELAFRSALNKGPGSLVAFDPTIDRQANEERFVQQDLPRALAASELELHFQPIVAAAGGTVVGVEALLRWLHAERGPIPPAVFIPVAEQMGLMDSLGAFVLRRALQEAKRWPQLYVSVNLSPLQVRHSGIVELVRRSLVEAGASPSQLVLEVTEGVLADNSDVMVRRIQELHALGVRIALDDFGSGYSNLAYLQRFPFDKLKIDKSLIDALGVSANGGAVVQAIVALGRALGLSITAEGVETEQQRVLLRLAGCDEMQGYLLGKPGSAKSIDALLKRPLSGDTARALTA